MSETGSVTALNFVAPIRLSEGLLRPIVFSQPLRLVEPTSWVPHIPFAFWLLEALAPRTVVELGTMSGNSYSAIAQAIQTLGLDASCYAVDSWTDHSPTGSCGAELFEEWSAFHDRHFGAFSRIVRSTFDEALTTFEDGSIDLLHINGLCSHESVRHDFESWLPKLSPKAVVLLHNINARELGFGVWQPWEQLKDRRPCFEFVHGHGLGVVGVGRDLPTAMQWLFQHVSSDGQNASIVRQFFRTLGEGLVGQERETVLARMSRELAQRLAERESETERLTLELNERLRAEKDTTRRLAAERSHSAVSERANVVLRAEVEKAHAQARTTIAELTARAEHNAALIHELDLLRNSRTWRWTQPLRDARRSLSVGLPRVLARDPKQSRHAVPHSSPEVLPERRELEPPVPVELRVSGHAARGRTDHRTRTIVCLSHVVPTSRSAGNEYRIHRLLTHLRRCGYRIVVVVSPLSEAVSKAQLHAMAEAYGNVVACDRAGCVRFILEECPDVLSALNGRQTQNFADLLGELEPMTREHADLLAIDRTFCHDTMIAILVRLHMKLKPCLVLAEYVWMTRALPLLDADVLTAVDTIDVFSTKTEKVMRFGIADWAVSPEEEAKRLARAKLILSIQREEALILEALAPDRPIIVTGVDFDCASSDEWPSQPLAFCVGSDNPMNRLGLSDFLRFAWPGILNAVPDARLAVAGTLGRVVPGGTRGVDVLGHVEELRGWYARSRVVVNPAAAGTGLKVKTVEALGHLRPVVAWPNGVDGLPPDIVPLVPPVHDWLEFAERVSGWLRAPTSAFDGATATLIHRQLSAAHVYAALDASLSSLFAEAGARQES